LHQNLFQEEPSIEKKASETRIRRCYGGGAVEQGTAMKHVQRRN